VLKRYISLLMMHPELIKNPILHSFLDTEHRGTCGVARALGPGEVHLEAFVDMSDPALGSLMWSTCYLVLTKSGQLFALEDCYDAPDKATLAVDLRRGGRVNASSGGRCDVVTSGGVDIRSFGLDFKDQVCTMLHAA
jgi:hypothetical protein